MKKTTTARRAVKPSPVAKAAPTNNSEIAHLAGWIAVWSVFACVLLISFAFLRSVDWKWLSEYAYTQTHQEELQQEQLLRALERTTCDMAIKASEASPATCSAIGYTKPTSTK